MGLDACFALAIIAGPPGQLQAGAHDGFRQAWRARLTPAQLAPMTMLLEGMAQAGYGDVPGPALALFLSAGDVSSLDALIGSVASQDAILRGLAGNPFAAPQAQGQIRQLLPVAQAALTSLREAGFTDTWEREQRPALMAAAGPLTAELETLDIISEHRRYLSRPLDPFVTVYLSKLSEPHGIRILGQRFVTSPDYPSIIVKRNAIHEMLHPLLESGRAESTAIIAALAPDPLLQAIVARANPAFGYSSIQGLAEEGAVQALEAIIAENLGFARDNRAYWRAQDGGMHVFAAAVYADAQATGFAERGGDSLAWLAQRAAAGALSGANLVAAAESIIGADAVARWRT